MDNNIMKGKWNQVKGRVKQRWGELTDDDIARIDGSKDKLIGTLQERLGRTKDAATREVADFLHSVEQRLNNPEMEKSQPEK
jgi:uncharacterized protein YjbJ (UPF0337 family)